MNTDNCISISSDTLLPWTGQNLSAERILAMTADRTSDRRNPEMPDCNRQGDDAWE